jgi:hypothetical protein
VRLAAGGLDFLDHRIDRSTVAAAVDQHGRTVLRQRERDRAADVLPGAGDQRDLSLQCL